MKLLVVVVSAAVFASSAVSHAGTSFYSDVSAYTDGSATMGIRYALVPEQNQKVSNSFEMAEFAGHVERILLAKGMVHVSDPKSADVIVFIGYGIGDPKKEVASYSLPMFGQTGVSSSSNYGKVSSNGSISATTTNTPSYGITGWNAVTSSYTTYDRWMRLAAVDLASYQDSKGLRERWRVEVKSSGSSGDLRLIFPVMAYSAAQYVGVNTGKAVPVKVKEKSKEYRAFLATPVSIAAP